MLVSAKVQPFTGRPCDSGHNRYVQHFSPVLCGRGDACTQRLQSHRGRDRGGVLVESCTSNAIDMPPLSTPAKPEVPNCFTSQASTCTKILFRTALLVVVGLQQIVSGLLLFGYVTLSMVCMGCWWGCRHVCCCVLDLDCAQVLLYAMELLSCCFGCACASKLLVAAQRCDLLC